MRYGFLVETYETERLKVLGVWSMFRDEDLPVRPRATDRRGRSVHEQMVHQCVGEDLWFRTMLGIGTREPALPEVEQRLDFIERYATSSAERLDALRSQPESWWEGETRFFDAARSRAWVVVRRIAHTSHHRGQQTAVLRMLGRDLHSNYGPTADTGGLMRDHAPVIYAYSSIEELLAGERAGGRKAPLPGPGERPPTERPGS
ncbi:MAG: damage-inducible protein DinB [Acidobacteria bacterium]|nr:damage-inducible protein DinB [Acidobacteriota bacterium]